MQTHHNIKKMRILVAEDHANIATIYSMYCNEIAISLGFDPEIITTHSGESALKLYREHFIKRIPFDYVLLDIGLPDIDGIKVCEQIRSIDKDVIIIAQSGYGNHIAKACYDAGCNDYLVKGFSYNDLRLLFDDYVRRAVAC